MNSSMYTVFVARSIVHVKHVGGGGIVGHFIFFGVTYSIIEDSNAELWIIFCTKMKKNNYNIMSFEVEDYWEKAVKCC